VLPYGFKYVNIPNGMEGIGKEDKQDVFLTYFRCIELELQTVKF
jgi:hypothetical protein